MKPTKLPVGPHNPIGLLHLEQWEPYVCIIELYIDHEGYQRGTRLNGAVCCPGCDRWYPIEEEPDGWYQLASGSDGVWYADSWWGAAQCPEWELLLAPQPDGRVEAYHLGE